MSRITRRQAKNRTGLRVPKRRRTRLAVEALERRELLSVEPHVLLTYEPGRTISSVAAVGDVNGDGLADVAFGHVFSYFEWYGYLGPATTISVFSGAENYRLRSLTPALPSRFGSYRDFSFSATTAALADANGDGVSDLLVGVPGILAWEGTVPDEIFVFSGMDGSLLLQRAVNAGDSFGSSVAGLGDLDRDGYPEFAVGAPGTDPGGGTDAGSIFIYTSRDGSLVRRLDGDDAGDHLGISLAGAGDVNGDGVPDLIAGDRGVAFGVDAGRGSAWVFSGADGSVLFHFGGQPGDQLGYAVAGAGDVTGDGHPDLIVGAPYADPAGQTDAGSAFLFSGFDGSLLYRFDGAAANGWFGKSASGVGDVDGDGVPDVIVGDPHGDLYPVGAHVYSGADGALIFQFQTSNSGSLTAVAGAGDATGDGRTEVLVGTSSAAYLLSVADRPSDLEGPRVNPSATQPIGFVPGPVDHIDLTFSEPVNSDTFKANDIVSLRSTNGPIDAIGDPVPLSGTNDQSFRISFPSQSTPGDYSLTIGPNIRDQATGLAGGLGNLMDQNLNGRKGEDPADRYTARFTIGSPTPIDRDVPRVLSSSLSGNVTAPVSSIDLTFSEPIDPVSFTTADITFSSPNGAITALDDPVPVDAINKTFHVTFDPQNFPGAYTFSVGPGIGDLSGNAMDQNQNGQKGEPNPAPAGDQFSTSFNVAQPRVVTVITPGLEPADYNPSTGWPGGMRDALTRARGLPAGDIILPNWSAQSGLTAGVGWTEAAGDKVFAEAMQKIVGQPIAVQPTTFHFIGHSRGAVVNSEALRRLSYYEQQIPSLQARVGGVQMTTLDPVPSPFNLDPDVQVWKGVDWADNYYQTSGFLPPWGMQVPGAFNLLLDDKLETGSRLDHSEVHDWYHWTIDTNHESDRRNYSNFDAWGPRFSLLDGSELWYSDLQLLPGGEALSEDDDWNTVGYNWALVGNDWGGLGNPDGVEMPVGTTHPKQAVPDRCDPPPSSDPPGSSYPPATILNGLFGCSSSFRANGKVFVPGFESDDTSFRAANGVARLTKPTGRTAVNLEHALSFVPPDATALTFKIRNPVSGAAGTLSVLWANAAQCEQEATTGLTTLGWVSLGTQPFRQWQTKSFSLPGKIDLSNGGQVGCFVFQLEGARKQLRVELDDITLQQPQTGRAIAASFRTRAALEIASNGLTFNADTPQHQIEGAEAVVRQTERDGTTLSGSAGTSDQQLGASLMITPVGSRSAADVSHTQQQTFVPPILGRSSGHLRSRVWTETIDELLASGLGRFDHFAAGVL